MMAESLEELIAQATAFVPMMAPTEAYRWLQQEPDLLLLDVRNFCADEVVDRFSGALNVPLGSLTYRADRDVPAEWREPLLQDRLRPILTVCHDGTMSALAGKLLMDMGFVDVRFLRGGMRAWKATGLPVEW